MSHYDCKDPNYCFWFQQNGKFWAEGGGGGGVGGGGRVDVKVEDGDVDGDGQLVDSIVIEIEINVYMENRLGLEKGIGLWLEPCLGLVLGLGLGSGLGLGLGNISRVPKLNPNCHYCPCH